MIRMRSLTSLAKCTFGDVILVLLIAATLRQYAWIISHDLTAWLVTCALSLALLFMHLHMKDAPDSERNSSDKRYLIFIWVLLAVLYLMRAFLPDWSFDVIGYHLTAAERAMHGFPYQPGDFFPSGMVTPPPIPEIFLGIFRSLFGYRLGTAGNLLILIWTAGILDRFLTAVSLSTRKKIIALVFIVLCENALFLLDTYMVDLIGLPLLLEVTWILFDFENISAKRYYVYYCMLLLGIAFALKLTNIAFVIPLMVWMVITLIHYRRLLDLSVPGLIGTAVLLGLVFLAPILPFSLFMYLQTANPIFPFYNGFFQSEYWPLMNFKDVRWGGVTLGNRLIWPIVGSFMPERLSELHSLAKHYSGRLALSALTCLPGLIFADARLKRLIIVWFAGSILWSFSTGYARYAVYLEVLGGLIIVLFLITLQARNSVYSQVSQKIFRVVSAVLILACVYQCVWALKLTSRFDWCWRPTIFQAGKAHAKNMRFLFLDRNLADFLDDRTRDLVATADAWAVASPATSGYASQINPKIPMINIDEDTFFVTPKAREKFAEKMTLLQQKRILTICDEDKLSLCTGNILKRGFTVRELTNIPLSYYGQDTIGYVFSLQQKDEPNPDAALDLTKTLPTGPLPDVAFNAKISLKSVVIKCKRDVLFSVPVSIRNASTYGWPALKTSDTINAVAISYHIFDADNKLVVADVMRTSLLYDVKPGQGIEQNAIVRSPGKPGSYVVEIDMIQEGVAWFAGKKSMTARCRITVL